MSLKCSLKPRELLALLNGIARLRFYGDREISVAFLQEQGAATGTQDVYGHTPLSYMPQSLKSVGRKTAFVDGREPSWVVSVVDEKSAVRQGAVAQVVATMTR